MIDKSFVQILNIVNHKLDSATLAYFHYSGQEYLVGVRQYVYIKVQTNNRKKIKQYFRNKNWGMSDTKNLLRYS